MRKLMSEREELNVVSDQIGSPTYAADLAQVIMEIIAGGIWVPGIYHFSNSGVISWYDFAVAIRDLSGLQCRVQPIPSSQYPTPAKRPAYSVMDTTKIFSTFKLAPKPWRESLIRCLDKL
jgi:dTDP-4-dehydrorhamnose reductase